MSTSIRIGRARSGWHSVVLALGAAAAVASAQTTPVGTTRPAAYDCSGLEGVALASCRQLNADAVTGAVLRNAAPLNSTHDCAGMTGGALATCRDLNGQQVAPNGIAPGVAGAGGAYGGVPSLPSGSPMTPSTQPASGTTANSTAQGSTTPITQQTTGGTNPIAPSGTGTTATTGGTNPAAPSGTGTITFSDGTTVNVPGGTGATTTAGPSSSIHDVPPVKGGKMTTAPGGGQVSPPNDVVAPMSGAAGMSAPTGAVPAGGAAKSGK